MKHYIEKIIVPFISKKREELQPYQLWQYSTVFVARKHPISPFWRNTASSMLVPANCIDRLQPMDISINKPVKEELRKKLPIWYAAKSKSN